MDLIVAHDVQDIGAGASPGGGNGTEYFRTMFLYSTSDLACSNSTLTIQFVATNTGLYAQVITLKCLTSMHWADPGIPGDQDSYTTGDEQSFTVPGLTSQPTLFTFSFVPKVGTWPYFWSIPIINGLNVYATRIVEDAHSVTSILAWRPLCDKDAVDTINSGIGDSWGSPDVWRDDAFVGTFYWDPDLYQCDTLSVIIEATFGSTFGGITGGARLYDITVATGVAASEFLVTSGGAFRVPSANVGRVEFDPSYLTKGHLYKVQYRRNNSWGGGVTTDWLSSALLSRACLYVRLTGNIKKIEAVWRVAKQISGPTIASKGTSRAIVQLPVGTVANSIRNETCSAADFGWITNPQGDFWITDDGTNVSGDGASAVDAVGSNAHQNPVGDVLPIFSGDFKDNFISGHSYCARFRPTIAGGDANSRWSLICIVYVEGGGGVIPPPVVVTGYRLIEYFGQHELFGQIKDAFFVHCGLTWDGGTPVEITNITQANPAVVTAADHGLIEGDHVRIRGVLGMVEINNEQDDSLAYTVTNVTETTFELAGVDSSAYGAFVGGSTVEKVTNRVTGLPDTVYTTGRVVAVLGDGKNVWKGKAIASGTVEFPFYANIVHVGLNFSTIIEPMNPNAGSSQGTARGKKQKVNRATFCFYQTNGCKVGIDQDHLFALPDFTPGQLYTGDITKDLEGEWEDKASISIVQDDPLPLTIKAIIPRVNINEET